MKTIEKTQEAYGCGDPQPIFLYWPAVHRHIAIATSVDDRCGDLFIPSGIGESSFLLCEDCGVSLGLNNYIKGRALQIHESTEPAVLYFKQIVRMIDRLFH